MISSKYEHPTKPDFAMAVTGIPQYSLGMIIFVGMLA